MNLSSPRKIWLCNYKTLHQNPHGSKHKLLNKHENYKTLKC